MTQGMPLPVVIDTVLLPYKGQIIYDGMGIIHNVSVGPGIRAGLQEEYLTAKQNGRLLTSLEPETLPQKTPAKIDKMAPECKKNTF